MSSGQPLLFFFVPLNFLKFKFEKAWTLVASLIPWARQSWSLVYGI